MRTNGTSRQLLRRPPTVRSVRVQEKRMKCGKLSDIYASLGRYGENKKEKLRARNELAASHEFAARLHFQLAAARGGWTLWNGRVKLARRRNATAAGSFLASLCSLSSGSHKPLRHWGLEVTRPCARRPLVVALLRQRTTNKQRRNETGPRHTLHPTSTGGPVTRILLDPELSASTPTVIAGRQLPERARSSDGQKTAAVSRAKASRRRGRVMRSSQRGLLKGPCRR